MRKLDRYIGITVFLAILAVLGVILGLSLLFAFIDQLSALSDSYTLGVAAKYILLTTPGRVYDLLPMAALIGCLVGLGTLASNSELTVMRAAGVSLQRIVWAVMKPMLVLMFVGILIGEYVVPSTETQAQSDRALAQSDGGVVSSRNGLWHRQGQEFIHINVVQADGVLLGVTRYDFDEQHRLLRASFARRGTYQGEHWVLEDISTTLLHPDEKRSEVQHQDSENWSIQFSPKLLNTVVMEPEALSISGLWDYIHYLQAQGLSSNRYWLAFWTKVLQPAVTAALVLMAISFIFGPLRSVTLGQRVFTGVLVGFTFRIAQDLLGPSSQVFGFPPLLAVLLPACFCALLGFWLLRRAG